LCVFFFFFFFFAIIKDVAGNAPLFMCKTKELEQKMRKAEKNVKKKLDPIVPPGREIHVAKPVAEPEGRKKSSIAGAASQLVQPVDDDAKSVKGVAWNTLRGILKQKQVFFDRRHKRNDGLC
jgi:hypothetical protein